MPGLLVVAALLAASRPAPCPQSRSEARCTEWAHETAVALDSLDPGDGALAALGARLDAELGGARIVLLGSPDHFVAERIDARWLLLRLLLERGWRHVGMEMGRSDAVRMDRYLADGDAAQLERVALFGHEGDLRADRDDTVPGFAPGTHPELDAALESESRWLLARLREWNAARAADTPRARWFGYDVAFLPGGGYAEARELLAPHAGDAAVAELAQRLERVPGESRAEEVERLDAARARLAGDAALQAALGAGSARALEDTLRDLAEALRWVDGARLPRGSPERRAALEQREVWMKRRLDALLDELPAGERVVLLGHDLHLGRGASGLQLGGEPLWETLGAHLAATRPDEVYVVWTLAAGRHAVPGGDPPVQALSNPAGSVEAWLAGAFEGPAFLPLRTDDDRAAWLARRRTLLGAARAVPADQADALLWIPGVGPPRVR